MDLEDLFGGGHRRRHGRDRGHEARGGQHGHDGHGEQEEHAGPRDHDDRGGEGPRRGSAGNEAHAAGGGLDPRHDPGSSGHRGFGPQGLQRELLAKLLANKPALFALAGLASLVLVLATWLLVTIIGAVGQGGLAGVVEAVVAPLRSLLEATPKPGKGW
jgi:hypothetical protein